MARKQTAWWEQTQRGPFAPWKCACCGGMSTFSESADADYLGGASICSECCGMFCSTVGHCVLKCGAWPHDACVA